LSLFRPFYLPKFHLIWGLIFQGILLLLEFTASGADLVDLKHPPIHTFSISCSRCHGPNGIFFEKEFLQLKSDVLEKVVIQMMKGPALIKASTHEEQAMLEYHYSLQQPDGLFLLVQNAASARIGSATRLVGEVSLGASVQIEAGTETLPATVSGTSWIREPLPPQPCNIRALRGQHQALLSFPEKQWIFSPVIKPATP
jgi:hypothetical protein